MKIIGIGLFCILLFGCSKVEEDPLLNNPSQECLGRAGFLIKQYREEQYGKVFNEVLYRKIVDKNKEILKKECK